MRPERHPRLYIRVFVRIVSGWSAYRCCRTLLDELKSLGVAEDQIKLSADMPRPDRYANPEHRIVGRLRNKFCHFFSQLWLGFTTLCDFVAFFESIGKNMQSQKHFKICWAQLSFGPLVLRRKEKVEAFFEDSLTQHFSTNISVICSAVTCTIL